MNKELSFTRKSLTMLGAIAVFWSVEVFLSTLLGMLLCADYVHLKENFWPRFVRHLPFNSESCFTEYWWLYGFMMVLTLALALGYGWKILTDTRLKMLLRNSERRLNEAFKAVNEGVFEWYFPEDEIYFSESLFRLCGLPMQAGAIPRSQWRTHIHPDDLAHDDRQVQEALKSGVPLNFQIRLRHGDGHYFPAHVRGSVRQDGKRVYIIGTVRDISGDLAAQQRLNKLETRLHSTLLATGEGILELSLPDLIVQAEMGGGGRIAGIPWEKLNGLALSKILSPEQFTQVVEWLNDAVPEDGGTPEPLVMDAMMKLQDDLTVPARLVFNGMTGENMTSELSLNVRDLTRERESALNSMLLKLTSDNLLTGIVIARKDGVIYYSNAVIRSMVGVINPNFKIWDLLPSISESDFRTVFEEAKIRGTHAFRWSFNNRIFEVNCYYLMVSDGFVCFYVNDRTNAIAQENKLLKALTAEQRANQKRLELLNNINYELRKPLTGILGFADLLQDDSLPPEERREYLNFITESGNHLLKLWSSVLELTTLECGMLDIEVAEVNINSIMTNVQNIARPLLNSDIEFRCRKTLRDVDAVISSDESILDRIFEKFLENAVQRVKRGWIEIGYKVEGGQVSFYVSDSGPTLSPEQRQRVFEPFGSGFWSHGDTVKLGLAIAKLMVALVHGSISVLDNPGGEGSCFCFTIPTHLDLSAPAPALEEH